MSAFLGPIHTWLYNKIKLQEDITTAVINVMTPEKKLEIISMLDNKFSKLPEGNLEDNIDTENIHGWLQEKVRLVEERYVYVISIILNENLAQINDIKSAVIMFGKTYGIQTQVNSLADCFKLMNDTVLDGMPCDHINQIVSEDESSLTYKRKDSYREELWGKYGQDINLYYDLRLSFINGLLAYTQYRLKAVDSYTAMFYKDSITLMMSEHQYILRMVEVIRKACYLLMTENKIDYTDFEDMILFIRNYADKHHHGKEEKILFKQMTDNLGKIADNLIRHGMLVEHDLGRLFMKELEDSIVRVKDGDDESRLDIIANAISYTHLITRHIGKEDDLIYSYGQKNLSAEIMNTVNKDTIKFETDATNNGIQKKYIAMLERFEEKYLK